MIYKNWCWENLYPCQRKESSNLLHFIHKNHFKMHEKFKCITPNYQITRKRYKGNLHDTCRQ